MSAAQQPAGTGWLWSEGELARAKDLRREGYTHGTIAGLLREEFGTERSGEGVRKLFVGLRQRGEVVETVEDHERQAQQRRKLAAELALANTMRRRCLSCDRDFDSHGPGNRICANCRASEAWR